MRILLTQARSALALEMARHLHRAGHVVVVADTLVQTVCRYSSAVSRAYVTAAPWNDSAGFLADVRRIVERERIERIIPIFEEALYLAQDDVLAPLLFAAPFVMLDTLHNKHTFARSAKDAGLAVAETTLVTSKRALGALDEDVTYALKPCYARAAQALVKYTPDMPASALDLSPGVAYVAQRWIDGRRFCSYSVCEAGVVRAHVVYPVNYTVDGHSCVYFTPTQHAGIDAWVHTFARALGLRGQVGIDFIEAADGTLYAIECNPRATSGVHLFGPGLHLAFALTANGAPQSQSKDCDSFVHQPKQVGFGMLAYAWRKPGRGGRSVRRYLWDMATTQDVVFDWGDLGPWLMQPGAFFALWRKSRRLGTSIPDAFLSDHAWNQKVHFAPCDDVPCTDRRRYA